MIFFSNPVDVAFVLILRGIFHDFASCVLLRAIACYCVLLRAIACYCVLLRAGKVKVNIGVMDWMATYFAARGKRWLFLKRRAA